MQKAVDVFDAREAQCATKEDEDRLLSMIESAFGDLPRFNQAVRDMFLRVMASRRARRPPDRSSPRSPTLGGRSFQSLRSGGAQSPSRTRSRGFPPVVPSRFPVGGELAPSGWSSPNSPSRGPGSARSPNGNWLGKARQARVVPTNAFGAGITTSSPPAHLIHPLEATDAGDTCELPANAVAQLSGGWVSRA